MNDSGGGEGASLAHVRTRYLHFAEHAARGASPVYEALARAVAGSQPALRFIATLPQAKQQPNLVFAAVRHLHGVPRDGRHLEQLIARDAAAIRDLVERRSTQTNEPARCATLLPALARLRPPLALLEVGASAGLCLLPDRYRYRYGSRLLEPARGGAPDAPLFPCDADANTPVPERIPEIAWRAGLDLNPIDVRDAGATAWLETLVWPGQAARGERLRLALGVARRDPPPVRRGDLLDALPELAATAPAGATLVVFHSAVLAYVAEGTRRRFARLVGDLGAVWISNESPDTLPWIAAKLQSDPPKDRFLLAVDGEPVAFTGLHGQSVEWVEERVRIS
jgi:hypothetical protein